MRHLVEKLSTARRESLPAVLPPNPAPSEGD
jgi:hypothetical protein